MMISDKDKDGGHSLYYDIPSNAKDIGHLIEYKGMTHNMGEAFCAIYRLHDKDTPKRNLEKVIYYANRELEKLAKGEEK